MMPPTLTDFDGFARHLTDDTFVFDSPEISFRLNASPDSHFFEGPGTIQVSKSGGIIAKLFPRDSQSRSWKDVFGEECQAGRIVPETEYYEGYAVEQSGRRWQLTGVFGNFEFAHNERNKPFCCEIPCHDLRIADKYYPFPILGTSLQMAFNFDLAFPPNAGTERQTKEGEDVVEDSASFDRVELEVDEIRIGIRSRRSPAGNRYVVLTAQSEATLPEHLEWSITESLQLALATECPWIATQRNEGDAISIRIRRPLARGKSSLRPPTSNMPGRSSDTWLFFSRYLSFVKAKTKARWHDLATLHYDLLTAPSFDGMSLAAAVGVEGASRFAAKKLGIATESEDWSKHRPELIRLFKDWLGSPKDPYKQRTFDRLSGFVNSSLKAEGTLWMLKQIAKHGVVTLEQVEAWSALRNPSAHAEIRDGQPTQGHCNRQGAVISMFYRMVAFVVGYQGKLKDYGSVGWKSVDAPLSLASAESAEIGNATDSQSSLLAGSDQNDNEVKDRK